MSHKRFTRVIRVITLMRARDADARRHVSVH
jgi:hypothetical protein